MYKITCLNYSQAYNGEPSGSLNICINNYSSKVNKENLQYHSFEIAHFKTYSFDNNMIESLAHIENHDEKLRFENDWILKYGTLFHMVFSQS